MTDGTSGDNHVEYDKKPSRPSGQEKVQTIGFFFFSIKTKVEKK